MCKKEKYSGRRIDPCLMGLLEEINAGGRYRTLLSCCGHNKYARTVVVMDKKTGAVREYFSGIALSQGVRKSRKYYKKDKKGYYYIPECLKQL